MNLKTLSDQDLETNLQHLIIRERKVLHWILEFIKEIERRKLYLQKGRSSLFQYLTQDLGYSAGSAQRRIEAIRLMTQAPELAEKIQSGAVTLSQVGILAQAIKQKEAETGEKVPVSTKRELLLQVENQNTSITQQIVSQGLDLELKPLEKKHVQKDHSVSLTVTLTQEQYEKLLRCQELLGHKLSQEHKTPTVVSSIEALCDYYLAKKDLTAAKAETKKSLRSSEFKNLPLAQGKTILEMKTKKALPQSIRKKVFQKYLGCQYRSPGANHVCSSKYKLEIEHLTPQWVGKDHSFENLTLLCAGHNKFKYRQQAGF